MELLAVPLVALASLYVINNQKKQNNATEAFQNIANDLPNTNIQNKNHTYK